MKTIYNINKWSFIITLVLYLTITWGLFSQIILGFIQLLLAFYILTHWKAFNSNIKKLISVYWIFVI